MTRCACCPNSSVSFEAWTWPSGTRVAACDAPTDDKITGAVATITEFDVVGTITAPRGALSVDDLAGAGSAA